MDFPERLFPGRLFPGADDSDRIFIETRAGDIALDPVMVELHESRSSIMKIYLAFIALFICGAQRRGVKYDVPVKTYHCHRF